MYNELKVRTQMGDASKICRTHGDCKRIGERIGVTNFQVCRILAGDSDTTVSKFRAMAEFFGATPNDLLSYIDEKRRRSSVA